MKTAEEIMDEVALKYTGSTFPVEMTFDAMEEYAEQYKAQWISIDDRLPELNKEVLLFNRNYAVPFYGIGQLVRSFMGHEWQMCDTEAYLYDYTHWMLLPGHHYNDFQKTPR